MKEAQLGNVIYMAVIGICEERESNGSYHGNGHHLAQEITESVKKAIIENESLLFTKC